MSPRGPLDNSGEWLSHQLPRTLGCIPGTEVICGTLSPITPRQRHSNSLPEQDGWYPFTCSQLTAEVWNWYIKRDITIHAEHLPGRENVRADWESMLHRGIFSQLNGVLGPFTIDMFASRTNAQLPLYTSWKPDPTALTIDAFSIYMYPPFALIPRCLAKLKEDQIAAVIIAPAWPNQVWFPQLLGSLISSPHLLPPIRNIVSGPRARTIQRQ